MLLQRLESGSSRRKHQSVVALVVAVYQDLHQRPILPHALQSLRPDIEVRDTQDEFVDQARVVIEGILGDC
jgi:hypothetical protein